MNPRGVLRHRPLVLPLALMAALAMLAISESTYWRSSRALDELVAAGPALATAAGRADLHHALMLGRVGVAALCLSCLVALYFLMRQSLALQGRQHERQALAQAEHERVEAARRAAQLGELAHHLQTAREDERARLARDLHDELGALLTSAKLDAARIRSRLHGQAPEALERLAHLVATLDSVIALKRRITEDLRPSSLSHLGLVATLGILAREFGEVSGTQVHCEFAPARLSPTAELAVYRVVQEAVTNISKYARASEVWFAMGTRDGGVEISVRDDGVGFDQAAVRATAYGLVGMRFRIEAEGGTLVVTSAPRRGTLIRVTLPQAAADDATSPVVGPSAPSYAG